MLQTPQTTPAWLDLIRSPSVVLFALAACVKWVVAPAIAAYMRHELQTELKQIASFPLFVDRVERMEAAVEKLAIIPEQLARIEEKVEALSKEES